MAMISMALPVAVFRPSPLMASGQIAGQTSAFARPNSATQTTVSGTVRWITVKFTRSGKGTFIVNSEGTKAATAVSTTPSNAESMRAFDCEMNLGIVRLPMI